MRTWAVPRPTSRVLPAPWLSRHDRRTPRFPYSTYLTLYHLQGPPPEATHYNRQILKKPESNYSSRRQAGWRTPAPGLTYARTQGRTTRRHNASDPTYWMGAGIKMLQSNPLKWIALGPDHEPPLRQSVHLSVFYTLHCV